MRILAEVTPTPGAVEDPGEHHARLHLHSRRRRQRQDHDGAAPPPPPVQLLDPAPHPTRALRPGPRPRSRPTTAPSRGTSPSCPPQVTGHTGLHLEVSTFGKWARGLLGAPPVMGHEDTAASVRRFLKPVVTDLRYFGNEVEYLMGRFETGRLPEYLDVKREGRAPPARRTSPSRTPAQRGRPAVQRREGRARSARLERRRPRGRRDVDDRYAEVGHRRRRRGPGLSANQVRAVLAHLADPATVTFIMDAAQRIYPRHFTWKEAGIDSFVNRYSLANNYRNTRQIAAFARPLVDGLPMEDDEPCPTSPPARATARCRSSSKAVSRASSASCSTGLPIAWTSLLSLSRSFTRSAAAGSATYATGSRRRHPVRSSQPVLGFGPPAPRPSACAPSRPPRVWSSTTSSHTRPEPAGHPARRRRRRRAAGEPAAPDRDGCRPCPTDRGAG